MSSGFQRFQSYFPSLFLVSLSLAVSLANGASDRLWPLPLAFSSSGFPLPVSPAFSIETKSSSRILKRGLTRYLEIILKQVVDQGVEIGRKRNKTLDKIVLEVRNDNETLQVDTAYWYVLQVLDSQATIEAKTPFGALYGLETFSQLIEDGSIINSEIYIYDQPRYVHRGLMLDVGRRIFPMELLYNILDGMSYVKLNVLHFHLSDWCRFSVESKIYPELQNNHSEFYTQEQIKSLVSYAADRGIRVIPEVESLSHVNGMVGLVNKTKGLKFCNQSGALELYNDPEGMTVTTMKGILEEIMTLFPDKYFHLGLDEVNPSSVCTLDGMKTLEQELMEFLGQKGRMAYAWQEAFTVTSAAIPMETVLQVWKNLSLSGLIDHGFLIVNSLDDHFYLSKNLNSSAPWTDIAAGLLPDEMSSVLGGEMAMWTDRYCYILECIFPNRTRPVGWWMYGPDSDAQFTESVTGIIWPQAISGAGSFWNYQSSLTPDSEEFQMRLTSQHKRLIERGILACPPGCSCDFLTKCGYPYPHP